MDIYLSEEVKSRCDFKILQIVDGEFIKTQSLQRHQCDVVYRLEIGEKTGYVYIQVEHSSTVDGDMLARMVEYQATIVARHLRAVGKYPTIISKLMYCGEESPYPYATKVQEYLENPGATIGARQEDSPDWGF